MKIPPPTPSSAPKKPATNAAANSHRTKLTEQTIGVSCWTLRFYPATGKGRQGARFCKSSKICYPALSLARGSPRNANLEILDPPPGSLPVPRSIRGREEVQRSQLDRSPVLRAASARG